jgi:hypothetical protein
MEKQPQIITSIPNVAEYILDKLCIFALGTDGGIGKSTAMNAISDYFDENGIPINRVDCDIEKTKKGSFSSFHKDVIKADIRDHLGADVLLDAVLESPSRIAIADLAANLERHSLEWFEDMFEEANENGIRFLVVCVATNSSGSVEAIIRQAARIQKRAKYLLFKNMREVPQNNDPNYFGYIENSPQGKAFLELAKPSVVLMEFRVSEIQNELHNRGLTLYQALYNPGGKELGPLLSKGSCRMRMQGYHRRLQEQLRQIKEELAP